MRSSRVETAVFVCALALTACGGGGGAGANPSEDGGPEGASSSDSGTPSMDAAEGAVGDSGENRDSGESGDSAPGGDSGPSGDAGKDGGIVGHNGLSLAASGVSCSSTHYQMVVTLGQSPGGNTTSTSTSYQLHGGLVGATQ